MVIADQDEIERMNELIRDLRKYSAKKRQLPSVLDIPDYREDFTEEVTGANPRQSVQKRLDTFV